MFESLLCSEGIVVLPNNERLQLPDNLHIIWEVCRVMSSLCIRLVEDRNNGKFSFQLFRHYIFIFRVQIQLIIAFL